MPAQTRPSGRFTRTASHPPRRPAARFGRASSPSGRVARPTAAPTRGVPRLHRRRPAQSAPQKALHALRGIAPAAIGGKAASKASKPGRKPLGLAVAAGAAGLAFMQRDKVMAKLRGGHDEHVQAEPRQDGSV